MHADCLTGITPSHISNVIRGYMNFCGNNIVFDLNWSKIFAVFYKHQSDTWF